MSETPRTDAEAAPFPIAVGEEAEFDWVPAEFARALERELAAALAKLSEVEAKRDALKEDAERYREEKNNAYLERNRLVAFLASIYPSGIKRTAIEGWSDDWHGCVYIDFPWGQASWHYHDSHAHLFKNLPAYNGEWDGHTTEQKYAALDAARKK